MPRARPGAKAEAVAIQQHRQCHERVKPTVVRVQCRPKSSAWDCSFALTDGLRGLATVRPGTSHAGWWTYSSVC